MNPTSYARDKRLSEANDVVGAMVQNHTSNILSSWYSAVENALQTANLPDATIRDVCKSYVFDSSLHPDSSSDETVVLREVFLGDIKIAQLTRSGFSFKIKTGNLGFQNTDDDVNLF